MPTLTVSSLESPNDVATIRIFLPSLLKTVSDEEFKRFDFVIYIGYDEGDRYYDNEASRKQIEDKIKEMVGNKPVCVAQIERTTLQLN